MGSAVVGSKNEAQGRRGEANARDDQHASIPATRLFASVTHKRPGGVPRPVVTANEFEHSYGALMNGYGHTATPPVCATGLWALRLWVVGCPNAFDASAKIATGASASQLPGSGYGVEQTLGLSLDRPGCQGPRPVSSDESVGWIATDLPTYEKSPVGARCWRVGTGARRTVHVVDPTVRETLRLVFTAGRK